MKKSQRKDVIISSYQGFVIIFVEDVEDLFIFVLPVVVVGPEGSHTHRRPR